MHTALAVGAVVAVLILAAVLFRRRDTGYEVDKFERARSLTTEWARRAEGAPTAPPMAADEKDPVAHRRDGRPDRD